MAIKISPRKFQCKLYYWCKLHVVILDCSCIQLTPDLVAEKLCLFLLVPCRFIDRGEFGEVYQGTAFDILGPDTGPTPVAVKVRERLKSVQCMCLCTPCTPGNGRTTSTIIQFHECFVYNRTLLSVP